MHPGNRNTDQNGNNRTTCSGSFETAEQGSSLKVKVFQLCSRMRMALHIVMGKKKVIPYTELVEKCAALQRAMFDTMFIQTRDGRFTEIAGDLGNLAMPKEEALESSIQELNFIGRKADEILAIIGRVLDTNTDEVFEYTLDIEGKGESTFLCHMTKLSDTLALSVVRDVTERRKIEKALQDEASADFLTGLPKKRALMKIMQQVVINFIEHGEDCMIIQFDLDNFKRINDCLGHDNGDAYLKEFSAYVKSALREQDILCRVNEGGDEFIVLLRNTSLKGAQIVAEKLLSHIQAFEFEHDGQSYSLTASIGITSVSKVAEQLTGELTPDTVISAVDKVMYRAKKEGKNKYCINGHGASDNGPKTVASEES